MDHTEAFFYYALLMAHHGNFRAAEKIRMQTGNWHEAWEHHVKTHPCDFDPEQEWNKLMEQGITVITESDALYPSLLHETPWAPLVIYARGNLDLLKNDAVAIVGTRKATPQGIAFARDFAGELSRAGFVIVSGLALGIDAAAHEGTLEARGHTIAVLGNGIDAIFPKTNERLGEKILKENGLILSEYPPGTPSLPAHFLERNRIIAGLARGVLVVEAPTRSGTIATARYAAEAGRDVWVVPGSITHPNFQGSHALIREGAILVRNTEDILESLGVVPTPEQTIETITDPSEQAIAKVFNTQSGTVRVETLIEASGLPAGEVNRALAFLTMRGMIMESGEGYEWIDKLKI